MGNLFSNAIDTPFVTENTIPVFFCIDDKYVKYAQVALKSLISKCKRKYRYNIHFLASDLSQRSKWTLASISNPRFFIYFNDPEDYINELRSRLPVRDYYSLTTYYRLFIADMFPQYKKVIYLDSDMIVKNDLADLFDIDIGDNMLGAVKDDITLISKPCIDYVEKCLGMNHELYFNAGMLVINCVQFRIHSFLDKFIDLLNTYTFSVAQDQDYLNLICKDHVYYLDRKWNVEIFRESNLPIEEMGIIHYNITAKPWHYEDCYLGDEWWAVAKKVPDYKLLKKELAEYPAEAKARDATLLDILIGRCVEETEKEDNYKKILDRLNRAPDRVAILKKIDDLEREGKFDVDVEIDPPGKVLKVDKVDYLNRKWLNKMKSRMAFRMARNYCNNLVKNKQLIVKEIKGIENFRHLHSGAIITCNHFSPLDSFAIQLAYEASKHPRRKFYRVIKEGNFTSFPGFFGFLMRHCNTLPLSSSMETMKEFFKSTDKLLKWGHFILVYPEQSMWWNYRKPKPLKSGAFSIAADNNVPVLPCFITMADSDIKGPDGFPVQELTINIGEPIKPDFRLNKRENTKMMMEKNYAVWKKIYEDTYQMPLTYLCDEEKDA